MGKTGTKILKVDVEQLVKELNKALADEWLAYYQYWIGARVAVGMMRPQVVAELTEHAADELRHADMLVTRIVTLGGEPIIEPKNWYKETNCGYETPSDPKTKVLVKQNIDGERCAIDVYQKLLEMVAGKDSVSEDMIREILADEIEHEEDLEAILDDMKTG